MGIFSSLDFGLFTAFVKFGIAVSSQAEAKLFDESGTEVDEDVFGEVLKQPDLGVFLLRLENLSNGDIYFESVKCGIALCLHIEVCKSRTETRFFFFCDL